MARTKLTTIDAETDRFPETYLGDYDGELEYVIYEWQTRRYPVNAKVQGDVDGDFTVQAGRSDTISDPAIYTDDREARRRRAEYVHAAVDGRNVTSGEEMTVPISLERRRRRGTTRPARSRPRGGRTDGH